MLSCIIPCAGVENWYLMGYDNTIAVKNKPVNLIA